MSEALRRRKYRYNNVLIETERILDPQFDDAVLFFTGAQIEMLRNTTQYLNRLDTYVTEYASGYYLAPTAEEYDEILEIVADLEETLMGNENTIWGFKAELMKGYSFIASGAGDKELYLDAVPSGEVWRVEGMTARNEDTACSKITMRYDSVLGGMTTHRKDSPSLNELVEWHGMLTLAEEGQLVMTFYDCADGDHLFGYAQGYTVQVPG